MLLFYVDESGGTAMHGHLSAPVDGRTHQRDLFALSAVAIHDSSRELLARELTEVKARRFGAGAVSRAWGDTELKARYLADAWRLAAGEHARDLPAGYAAVADPARLDDLLRDLGQVFAKFRPLVFTAIVDKRELRRIDPDASPLGIAYAKLYQRAAQTLESVNRGEAGIFVADRQDEHEAAFDSGAMHAARQELAARAGKRPNFDLLIDKPVWIDPVLSVWDREIIQLADLVALATRVWYAHGGPPAGRHFLWDRIEPCFAAHWDTTKAQGGGIMVYPDPGPYPPVR